jgi:LmbE family N-acetylglucosaminyl deacetylase
MKKTILAVGAHPDDMEFGASGTLSKLVEEGNDAYLIICTDGSRGSDDPEMTHERLAKIRREEQESAAKIEGIKQIFFLNHEDTQLVSDLKLKEEIVRIIRTVRPEIVITMDPTFYYSSSFASSIGFSFINHTDHRAAALATMDAVFPLSRDRLTFLEHEKEGLAPHKTKELWMTSLDKTDYIFDISETLEKKIKALSMHKSQFKDFSKVEKMIRDRAEYFGKQRGYKFAENFIRLKLP